MGIHGEPGAERQVMSQGAMSTLTHDVVSLVCRRLNDALQAKHELTSTCTALAIMVNNLGAVSQAELLIVCKGVSDFLYGAEASVMNGNIHPVHMFCGSFMTSLQMTGASISCFMIPSDNGHMDHLLHEPTSVIAWNPGFQLRSASERTVLLAPIPRGRSAPASHVGVPNAAVYHASPQGANTYSPHGAVANGIRAGTGPSGLSLLTENYIIAITSALISHANELAALDRRTGDGDLGDTGTFSSFCPAHPSLAPCPPIDRRSAKYC